MGRRGWRSRRSARWRAGSAVSPNLRPAGLRGQRRGGLLEVAPVDDSFDEEAGRFGGSECSQLGAREWPVDDAVLAAAQSQPGGAADERLDVEIRRLRFSSQLPFQQVE